MTLTNPLALALAALSLPLILGFLDRKKVVERPVSNVMLFKIIKANTAATEGYRRLRHLLALLICLLALFALVLAAVDPTTAAREPRDLVAVVDTSASMGAVGADQSQTRLRRGTAELVEVIEALGPDDRVALISAGPRAEVIVGLTADRERVVEILGALQPLGNSDGDELAMTLASALCRNPEHASIVVVSDGIAAEATTACQVHHVAVVEPGENSGITGFTVREADALGLVEAHLTVANHSSAPRSVSIELSQDGVIFDVVRLDLPASGTADRLVRASLPDGSALAAHMTIDGEDALDADNTAFSVRTPGARVSALLVTDRPRSFLSEALRLHPRIDLEVSTPTLAADMAARDLIVVDTAFVGELPSARKVVAVGIDGAPFGIETHRADSLPSINRWAFEHPLFRFVDLDGVQISTAPVLAVPVDATPLIDTADGTLALSRPWRDGELFFLGFHPDDSDFVLRVAFANWIANVAEWASVEGADEVRATVGVGERLAIAEDGLSLRAWPAGEARGLHEVVPAPGVYSLENAAGQRRALVAANLFATNETALGLGTSPTQSDLPEPTVGQRPWRWAVALALLLLAAEWLLPGVWTLWRRFKPHTRLWDPESVDDHNLPGQSSVIKPTRRAS